MGQGVMFERFTERAKQTLVLAMEEARTLHHGFIGSEHILLGLIREKEGIAAEALKAEDITLERVREQVVRIVGSGEAGEGSNLTWDDATRQCVKVCELALREALSLGHNYIGTEHLLLAILRTKGVGARVLLDLQESEEATRKRVIDLVQGHPRPTVTDNQILRQISDLIGELSDGGRHGLLGEILVRFGEDLRSR